MKRNVLKTLSLLLVTLLVASVLGACKKDGSTSSPSASASASAKNSSGTAKTSPGASTKSNATATGTNQQTTQTGTGANQGQSSNGGSVQGSDAGASAGESASDGGNVVIGGVDVSGEIVEDRADLGGRVFTIKCQNGFRYVEPKEDGDAMQVAYYKGLKRAEQKFNFKYEWVQRAIGTGEFTAEFINSVMAGIKYADVIGMSTKQGIPVLAEQGRIAVLDDYIDFQNDPRFNSRYCQQTALWKGKHYGFNEPTAIGGYGIYYNRDLFSRDGVQDPQQTSEQGNWTWESFLNAAQTLTKDMNGDGINDQWGITIRNINDAGDALVYSNGSSYYNEQDGRINFALNEPKAVKALQFYSDLVNVYKVMSTDSKANFFGQGTAAMGIGWRMWQGATTFTEAVPAGFAVLPKGPDASTYNLVSDSPNFFAVPVSEGVNVKESVAVMKEGLAVWDPSEPDSLNVQQYLYNSVATRFYNQADIDYCLRNCMDPGVVITASFGDLTKVVGSQVYSQIVTMSTTPAAALEAVRGPAQDAIDSMIESQ